MTAISEAGVEQLAAQLDGSNSADFRAAWLAPSFDLRELFAVHPAAHVIASYERPSLEFALVGIGEAARVELPLGSEIDAARTGARELLACRNGLPYELRPRLLGGFAFDPAGAASEPWDGYARGSLVLPRLLFVEEGPRRGVVLAPGVNADELIECIRGAHATAPAPQPPPRRARAVDRDAWLAGVRTIAAQVRAGHLDKAVLATTQELVAAAPFDVGRVLAKLRSLYPECHVFSFRSGQATFLGASPELLVSLRGGLASALGLAGSARRGDTPEEDERLGRDLLASTKDRDEHETTVRAIREALAGVTEQLPPTAPPQLRRLRNIQHLATEIVGRVRPDVDVLELVRRLHPTPAVCGWPREAARRVISAIERFDRGWYAGPVGWLDADGEGEFAVALRAALVRLDHAWLFAGNGIMGDSQPEAELAEVTLKFRPLREALGASAS